MIAKVVHILEKPTSKGGIYYNLQLDVDGKKVTLNSFQATDNTTFKQASESGASVDITTSKNDKGYDNIDSVSLVPGTASAEKPIPQSTVMPNRQFKADPARQESIELQHYTTEVRELWVAGFLPLADPLVQKYLEILRSKLGVGLAVVATQKPPQAVQATPAAQKPVTPVIVPLNPQSTPEQVKKAVDGALTVPGITPDQKKVIKLLMAVEETKASIKKLLKDKGWTATEISDLSEPQAAIIIKEFTVPEVF